MVQRKYFFIVLHSSFSNPTSALLIMQAPFSIVGASEKIEAMVGLLCRLNGTIREMYALSKVGKIGDMYLILGQGIWFQGSEVHARVRIPDGRRVYKIFTMYLANVH